MKKLLFGIWIMSFGMVAFSDAATYYIDYSNGSDANNGTAESSPWQRAPGMNGFAGTYTHQAGDHFIFKGGVTWPHNVFVWTIGNSGTAGNPDYYGVDQTWYTGSSWARPIFDAGGSANPSYQMINMAYTSYITIDNFEFTNFYWNKTSESEGIYMSMIFSTGGSNHLVENSYFHNWSHSPCTSNDGEGNCTDGTGSSDALCIVCVGDSLTDKALNDIFDGSPNGTDSGAASTFIFIENSIARNMSNAFLPGCGLTPGNLSQISGNQIGPINTSYSGAHENAIETNGGAGSCSPTLIFDNVIQNVVGVTILEGNASGDLVYIYDNLFINPNSVPISLDGRDTSNYHEAHIYNNTIVGAGGVCVGAGPSWQYLDYENNHCMALYDGVGTDGVWFGTPSAPPTTYINRYNLYQSPTQATADGYTLSNNYRPTSSTSPTVGAGVNLSSLGQTNYPSIDSDFLGNPRPTISAWDIGAYEYAAAVPISETTPGLNAALVYPDPVTPPYNPTIRVCPGGSTSGGGDLGVTIFDVSGRVVNSSDAFNFIGVPTQGVGVNQFECYEYTWTGHKASGVYFAVIHAKGSGTTVKARLKFAVVR
jgi:hypothetical protein